MRSLILLLVLGLAATTTPARSSSRTIPKRANAAPTTVLVLGDSLAAGHGLRRSEAFPALLTEKANASGLDLNVINAGATGGTTAGGLRRLPPLLHRQHVDVLVIELGINDAFGDVPVPQIRANLQKIIDLTRARYPQVKIVIAGMQLPRYSADDYVTQFGAMYVELATSNQAALVPFLLEGVIGNPALNLPDLIHPNASGQKILAANIWSVLESLLRKSS
jgi:acyl-CoA thioesterase I